MKNRLRKEKNSLTVREQQIVSKVLQGLPNKSIANQLFISEQTVKFHCGNIYKKLGIPDRVSLLVACMQEDIPA